MAFRNLDKCRDIPTFGLEIHRNSQPCPLPPHRVAPVRFFKTNRFQILGREPINCREHRSCSQGHLLDNR